jgi:pyruvate/2-oxoglutarate dehydrogenase complex dihydrolipoamide dehydrogenase (E3) component
MENKMAGFDYDIGVIGAGSAGLTIAAGAARFGAKTVLVEKERLGGDCLYYGCVPSKTLIRTAQVRYLMNNAQRFGLPYAELSPVDFREVRKSILSVVGKIQNYDSTERFCGLGVKVEFGSPEFSDEHTVRLEGRVMSARNWVVATGSSPHIPLIEGLLQTPHLTNRDIFYLDSLPASMIILGGGPVSIEMAQAFARLGTKVIFIQHGEQILKKEDRDMADSVMKALEEEGVEFYLNSSVFRVRDDAGRREVVIKQKKGAEKSIRAAELLVASGREANLGGLGLERLGIRFNSGGLQLDARLRTDRPNIYGAGDVTGSYQFTHAAGYEGGIVLANAILHLPRETDYTYMPWCTYTDPELASIGMNQKAARQAGIEYSVWTEKFIDNDRALAERASEGRIKLLIDKHDKPIGIQILGPHAGDLIAEWVTFFHGNRRLSALAGSVHPYPTLAEINKRAAGSVVAKKLFSDRVTKALKFMFNLRGRACGPE